MSNVGMNVARIRASLGLSRYDVQQRTGLNLSYLAKVERGEVNPLSKNVKRLADGLGVTVKDLMQPASEAAQKWLNVNEHRPKVPCLIYGNNDCVILCVKAIFAVETSEGTLFFNGTNGLMVSEIKPELAFTWWLPIPPKPEAV